MRATLALFVALALSASRIGSAQTAPQPTRLENVEYYKVEYHRFKPGKADEGRAFIRKYYRPADRAAGIQVLEFTPVTGNWDWIAFFPVEPDFLVGRGLPCLSGHAPSLNRWWVDPTRRRN